MNMLQCTATADGLTFATTCRSHATAHRSDNRSGHHRRPTGGAANRNEGIEATIVAVEELGSDSFVYCTPTSQADVSLVARTDGLNTSEPGTTVHLMPDTSTMHVFDKRRGARLEG